MRMMDVYAAKRDHDSEPVKLGRIGWDTGSLEIISSESEDAKMDLTQLLQFFEGKALSISSSKKEDGLWVLYGMRQNPHDLFYLDALMDNLFTYRLAMIDEEGVDVYGCILD